MELRKVAGRLIGVGVVAGAVVAAALAVQDTNRYPAGPMMPTCAPT